jgi:SAM-dependent methyltransferase
MMCLLPIDCKSLYESPEQYDIEYDYLKDDIPYYTDLLSKHPGSVLELACGTGRVTVELSKAGFEMTGLDLYFSHFIVIGTGPFKSY